MRRLALITGASDGIGLELARVMARKGHDLALVARRRDRLDDLADEIERSGRHRPLTIACDLASAEGVNALAGALEGMTIEILVNNAGYGLHGRAQESDRAQQLGMIDLNVRALTDLTLRFLPQIVASGGKILQVASTAAFLPGPNMAVYYASKAYVLSFGEALSEEIKGSGATVSVLCPGPTSTGFQKRAGLDPALFKLLRPMDARAVAEAAYAGLMAGQRVIVPGALNKISRALAGLSPRVFLLPVIGRLQENRKA